MNIQTTIEALDITIKKTNNGWLIGLCPFHEDRTSSFAVNEENGGWICYAGCGKGSLTALVQKLTGKNLKDAKVWLKEQGQWVSDSSFIAAAKRETKPAIEYACPTYIHRNVPIWILERGFGKDILRKYDCGMCRVWDAFVVPVPQANALVYRRHQRWVDSGNAKWVNSEGFKSHKHLWGLPDLDLTTYPYVILVEGVLDALWLRQAGYGNTLAIFGGGKIGMEQARILKEIGRPVLCAFDNDEAGQLTTEKAQKSLRVLKVYTVNWLPYPEVKDVAELDPEILKAFLKIPEKPLDNLLLASDTVIEPRARRSRIAGTES